MATEVFMPKMSDHMEEGTIISWLVREDDQVKERQPILEVMTDKAVVEVEAPASGVLRGIRADKDAVVPVGTVVAFIAEPGEEVPELPPIAPAEPETEAAPKLPPEPAAPALSLERVAATPAARRLANELNVDLLRIKGTGPRGRIKEEDVRAFVEQQGKITAEGRIITPPSITEPVPEEEIEWVELTPIRRRTAERMVESARNAPHFALSVEVDMAEALRLREAAIERILAETGQRLSVTALLVKVVAVALRRYPLANAAYIDGRIQVHKAINVGVAVGAEGGLVVPVIRSADRKSLADITRELKAFQDKAESLRFSAEELSEGTFTLSNLGMYGIDEFIAIINPPQSAILAVGRIVKKPVGLPDDTIALRPLMTLTLSIDHRVLDGVQGSRFLTEVKELLEQPYFLL